MHTHMDMDICVTPSLACDVIVWIARSLLNTHLRSQARALSARPTSNAFTAKELRSAGYGANDLKVVGFRPEQLKDAFTATELRAAGFVAKQLKGVGFSETELIAVSAAPHDEYAPAALRQ